MEPLRVKNVLLCRRTYIATLAIVALTALGLYNHLDVALSIAGVAVGLAGSNAAEAAMKARGTGKYAE